MAYRFHILMVVFLIQKSFVFLRPFVDGCNIEFSNFKHAPNVLYDCVYLRTILVVLLPLLK